MLCDIEISLVKYNACIYCHDCSKIPLMLYYNIDQNNSVAIVAAV